MGGESAGAVPIRKEVLQGLIHTVRGVQVMLDRGLADLYQVETRALKQAVKRNIRRFPDDFMFVLNESEVKTLVSQSVIPSKGVLGGAMPFAFTEHGVAALSDSHDRFLILDGETVYHLGASLKDLGKKWFAFSKMDGSGLKVVEKLDALIRENLEALGYV